MLELYDTVNVCVYSPIHTFAVIFLYLVCLYMFYIFCWCCTGTFLTWLHLSETKAFTVMLLLKRAYETLSLVLSFFVRNLIVKACRATVEHTREEILDTALMPFIFADWEQLPVFQWTH